KTASLRELRAEVDRLRKRNAELESLFGGEEIPPGVQAALHTAIRMKGVNSRDQVDLALTEKLRQQEAQLAHVARLSTMGQLMAGIAHEINQPLYAIGNFADAATKMLVSDPDPR